MDVPAAINLKRHLKRPDLDPLPSANLRNSRNIAPTIFGTSKSHLALSESISNIYCLDLSQSY